MLNNTVTLFFPYTCGGGVFLLKGMRNKGLHFALQSLHKANVLMSRGCIAVAVMFKILYLESINIVLSNCSFRQSTAVRLVGCE